VRAWEILGETRAPDGTDIRLMRRRRISVLANGKPPEMVARGNVTTKCHFGRTGSKTSAFAEEKPSAIENALRISRSCAKCRHSSSK
jgi:hypothetical protein